MNANYRNSIKQRTVKLWNENKSAISDRQAAYELDMTYERAVNFNINADIHAVNIIHQNMDLVKYDDSERIVDKIIKDMIDSARDL